MKVTLKKDFAWCHDGIRATVIPAGSEVESPIAENAVQAGHADGEPRGGKAVSAAPSNRAHPEAPKNKGR